MKLKLITLGTNPPLIFCQNQKNLFQITLDESEFITIWESNTHYKTFENALEILRIIPKSYKNGLKTEAFKQSLGISQELLTNILNGTRF